MGTATSRTALLAAVALACAGCGGSSGPHAASPFSWLRPGPPPSGWPVARIPSGAAMAYPPGWTTLRGDRGTATVALLSSGRDYVGYLNVTPRQGTESLADWSSFRVDHNAEEGDRGVTTQASATGLRFRSGAGSCVRDSYTTATGARYIELACLVAGRRASTVIVGAAPPGQWAKVAPNLERAISSLTT